MLKRTSCFMLIFMFFFLPMLAKKQHKNHFINYTCNALANCVLGVMIAWHADNISNENDEPGSQCVPVVLTAGFSALALIKMKIAFDNNIKKERSNFLSLINASTDIGLLLGSIALYKQPLLSFCCISGYLIKYQLFNQPTTQQNII